MYDVIVTLDTENPEKDKRYIAISMRIEAESSARAKVEATRRLDQMGYGQYSRSAFSIRDAK